MSIQPVVTQVQLHNGRVAGQGKSESFDSLKEEAEEGRAMRAECWDLAQPFGSGQGLGAWGKTNWEGAGMAFP